jgi:hypothetical protein
MGSPNTPASSLVNGEDDEDGDRCGRREWGWEPLSLADIGPPNTGRAILPHVQGILTKVADSSHCGLWPAYLFVYFL